MSINNYPQGSVVVVYFGFTNQALTPAQQATLASGGGLPAGYGVTPAQVFFAYQPPRGTLTTLTGGQLGNPSTGVYSATLQVTAPGNWPYYAYGQDSLGNPVAATYNASFNVTANQP